MLKHVLLKGVAACLLFFLSGSLFAQSENNEDFVEVGKPLFYCDFQDPNFVAKNFVVYDEDRLTPTSFMASLGFEVAIPWLPTLRDTEESTNIYAGSTSAYTPAGQANDWLVTTGIEVPNKGYILKWKSQAFDLNKRDGLKVFISSTGQNITDFPKTPVFNVDEEEAGATENADGEWIDHVVNLDDYSGKTIYIAFVNQSNDKSILFLDDISVEFSGGYTIKNTSDEVVDNNTSVLTVKGELSVTGNKTVNAFTVNYKGGDGVMQTLTFDNLDLKKGEAKAFEFPEKLSIEVGKTTTYQLWAHVDGEINQGLNSSVASLAFRPERKIVIEEGTGAWCGACPTGIVAFEHLEKTFGDKIIPIAIHYNDTYHMADYNSFLGFTVYPMGYVNRKYLGSPMSNELEFSGETDQGKNTTFKDLAMKAMDELTLASVKLTGAYTDSQKKSVKLDTEIKFAIDLKDADYRLFYVVREEYLKGNQSNYYTKTTNPNMSDWSEGGKYGKNPATVYYKEVARSTAGEMSGITGMIPGTIEASKIYLHTFSMDLSSVITSPENVSVVAMLLDGKTGEVMNADMIYLGTPALPSDIKEMDAADQVSLFVEGSNVLIAFDAQAGKVVSTLCSVEGKVLDSTQLDAAVNNQVTLSSKGYRGVALLKLNLNGREIVKKVVF